MLSLKTIETINQPIDRATGLPNQAYTEAAFLHAERERVFACNWVCLGFESSMPAPNHATPLDFLGLPLVAVRAADAVLRIFHNVCSHRGQLLVREACKIRGGLHCPYHAWHYSAGGELRGTPHIGGAGVHEIVGFDRGKLGLKAVRSHCWMGMVFINLSGDALDFDDYLRPLTHRWEAFCGAGALGRIGALTRGAPQTMALRANWKLAVENYCEAYHLPWIHPELNRISKLEDHYTITVADNFAGQGSHAYTRTGTGDTLLPVFPDWPRDQIKQSEYISFYPNVLLGMHADHAYAMIVEPLAPNYSAEHWQLFYIDEIALHEKYAGTHDSLLNSWRAVFNEDVAVVEGMQNGRASPGFQGGKFSAVMDRATHHFHRWVANCFATAA